MVRRAQLPLYPGRATGRRNRDDFKSRWEQMKKLGQAKPIWVTEFGVYAEDDPTLHAASRRQ